MWVALLINSTARVRSACAASWRLLRDVVDPYRPERHYMRGPGPKWSEKHPGMRPAPVKIRVR